MKKKVARKEKIKMLPAPESCGDVQVRENTDVSIIGMSAEALIQKAIENKSAIDVIERLMAMRERVQKEYAEKAYRAAMAEFQSKCPIITKKKSADKYKYAPIESIIKQVGPLISEHGFSFDFDSEESDDKYTSILYIHHILGHTEKKTFTVKPEFLSLTGKKIIEGVQANGAARTYANRYNFCNGFGIMTADDDTDGPHPPTIKQTIDITEPTEDELAQVDALPENIKEGFKHIGYGKKSAVLFCKKFGFDESRIMKEINAIADMKAGSNV